MKKFILHFGKPCLLLLICFFAVRTHAQDVRAYQYKINLNNVVNDMLEVELFIPKSITGNNLKFNFPKIIPGTYAVYDFGRFVRGLKVYNKKGEELITERSDINTWTVPKGKSAYRITYLVEDTWDSHQPNVVFEPAGSNIEENKNFIINSACFFGYISGELDYPFNIEITKPLGFFGSTSLELLFSTSRTDLFTAPNYNELIDSPVMYCKPDKVTMKIGNTDILISTYSPNKVISAKFVASQIAPILEAERKYLGGVLPVNRYAMMIYLSDDVYLSKSIGALEHSLSSVFCLVEDEPEKIIQSIKDITAHEFYHIVTPLNIHSEEIHYFDYNDPKSSKHLWMYEGVTEYTAQHVQVKYGLMPIEQFLKVMSTKIRTAKRYNKKVPFTEMSKRILDPKYKSQYMNVYEKGALIGMCLDLKLLLTSNGEYDLQDLMRDLSKEYGPDAPFKDDELFGKIEKLTNPEIGEFIQKYISGNDPLPFKELMAGAGLIYEEEGMTKDISPLGGLENDVLRSTPQKKLYIHHHEKMDEFGRDYIKFKKGDILLEWNDEVITDANMYRIMLGYLSTVEEDDELKIKVLRSSKNGPREIELKTTIRQVNVMQKDVLRLLPDIGKDAMKIRKAWLGNYVFKQKRKK